MARRSTAVDPQDLLFLNPDGTSPSGLTFGVLRKTYAGHMNSALSFGWRKAHLGRDPDDADLTRWAPNAERVEVILPAAADEMLTNAATLLGQMDAHASECEKALLLYLTLPLGDMDRVHVGFERARSFSVQLARDRHLATVLVLHAPGVINQPYPLHAHCLIVPRRITGLGLRYGLYDDELIHDSGQAVIEAMWLDHIA